MVSMYSRHSRAQATSGQGGEKDPRKAKQRKKKKRRGEEGGKERRKERFIFLVQ